MRRLNTIQSMVLFSLVGFLVFWLPLYLVVR